MEGRTVGGGRLEGSDGWRERAAAQISISRTGGAEAAGERGRGGSQQRGVDQEERGRRDSTGWARRRSRFVPRRLGCSAAGFPGDGFDSSGDWWAMWVDWIGSQKECGGLHCTSSQPTLDPGERASQRRTAGGRARRPQADSQTRHSSVDLPDGAWHAAPVGPGAGVSARLPLQPAADGDARTPGRAQEKKAGGKRGGFAFASFVGAPGGASLVDGDPSRRRSAQQQQWLGAISSALGGGRWAHSGATQPSPVWCGRALCGRPATKKGRQVLYIHRTGGDRDGGCSVVCAPSGGGGGPLCSVCT